MAAVTQLGKIIESLGTNRRDIIATLVKAKCKGDRNSCNACPIANYARKKLKLSKRHTVQACHDAISVCSAKFKTVMVVNVSPAICRFMRAFDGGKIPKLVA